LNRSFPQKEMRQAILKYYDRARVVIMAAAVSDFRFNRTSQEKIKKENLPAGLQLETTPDILEELGGLKQDQLLVGFAAETAGLKARAGDKMKKKKVDLMVANDVSRPDIGFGCEENEVYLFWPDGREKFISKTTKRKISQEILTEIGTILNERQGNS